MFYVIKLLNNLLIEFNLNKFELLDNYDKDKIIKFVIDNKNDIDKIYISKHRNKESKNNKSYNKLLNEFSNDNLNKKLNCINGLFLFNQFILSCYKFIDNNLIISEKDNFIINKERYNKLLSFNIDYINYMYKLYDINYYVI